MRVALALSVLWGTGQASAQESAELTLGDRLRITSSNSDAFEGVLQTQTIRGLTLSGDQGESFEVPYSTLLRMERASGRNRRKGALIVGGFGLVVGAILGASADCIDCDDPYDIGGAGLAEASAAGTGAILGGVLLGGVGAIVGGFLLAPQRWVEVPLNP